MQRLFDTALSEPRESHVCANGALRLVLRMSRLGVLCLPVAGGGSRSMCTPVARSVTSAAATIGSSSYHGNGALADANGSTAVTESGSGVSLHAT